MATIKDIAKELNISAQAVSRALNDKNNISQELKKKVREKAVELGYTKNQLASSLRTKKTKLIGIFMFRRTFEIRQKVLEGIFTEARKYEYDILFFTIDSELDKEKSYTELCRQRMVDGVILAGIRLDDPHIKELQDFEIPTVILDTDIGGNTCMVSMDHDKAVDMAISIFRESGYEKIGLITGHIQAETANIVKARYLEVITDREKQFVEISDYTEGTGYLAAKSLLSKEDRPDAIIAINNPVAMGILKYAEEQNIKVPGELAVIQLNDIELSNYTRIPVSSISQSNFERGVEAVNMIHRKAKGEQILFNPKFIKRNTN